MKKLVLINVVLVLSLLLAGVAFAAEDFVAAADTYFSGGTKNITAQALYENLNDGDTSNDPYIISCRKAEHYEKGHIPGAVNIAAGKIFSPDVLATLPTDQQIVLYCYTGQTASWTTAGLRMLGYDAYNLLHGMSGWSANPEVYVSRFDPATVPDYPTVIEATEATETYDMPAELADTLADALNTFFSGGLKYITADAVFENLNDGDESNDPYIISVRSPDDYAKGHVQGAVNYSAKTMWTADTLATIPNDRQVVVYCYTGQTSAQVSTALRVLGYDAWSLKFGMSGWSADANVYAKRFDASKVPDYPTEGTAAEAPAAPATLPTTGGILFPIQGIVLGLGGVSLGVGLALRRRKAA